MYILTLTEPFPILNEQCLSSTNSFFFLYNKYTLCYETIEILPYENASNLNEYSNIDSGVGASCAIRAEYGSVRHSIS